jgi:cytidyltransferase-like protein
MGRFREVKKMKIVASGYFDPIHIGHIEYLKKAKELGGKLIVIVNNDKQALLKKGFSFMNEKERMEVVKNIKYVDDVFLSIDDDKTVCKSLEKLKPDIFAKGGDRNSSNIPEMEVCKKYNIKLIDGLGEKIQSSSNLITGVKK